MLHIISSTDETQLALAQQTISQDDVVIILADVTTHELADSLCDTLKNRANHVVAVTENMKGKNIISFHEFVRLCERNSPIHTWY